MGTISAIAAAKNIGLNQSGRSPKNHPISAAAKAVIPNTAVIESIIMFQLLLSNSKEGLYRNRKGTIKPANPNLKDRKPVFMALVPAIPLAAYALMATGGVIKEIIAK